MGRQSAWRWVMTTTSHWGFGGGGFTGVFGRVLVFCWLLVGGNCMDTLVWFGKVGSMAGHWLLKIIEKKGAFQPHFISNFPRGVGRDDRCPTNIACTHGALLGNPTDWRLLRVADCKTASGFASSQHQSFPNLFFSSLRFFFWQKPVAWKFGLRFGQVIWKMSKISYKG